MNVDLHCHSSVSDGTLAPQTVARRAADHGVDVWALTDHDEISGQAAAHEAANSLGLTYVGGVEISVTWAHETVHILGLHIDYRNQVLHEGLVQTRRCRTDRARAIGRELETVGIKGGFEGALALAGNPDMIARPHFARYIVEQGVCQSVPEVFTRYLARDKPGYVPMRWAHLGDAIGWIRAAGGVAVVAHPARYKFTELEHDAFFDEFRALGGGGIEVVCSSHTAQEIVRYSETARKFGLKGSRGSDFHSPEESNAELGRLPPLPDAVTPVWSDWF